jgi:hypothetical protein
MNERIKKLAKQAGMEPEDGVVWWVSDEDLQKFANLIALECAKIAVAIPCPIEEGISRQTQGHTWDMACVAAAIKIKEHFGVAK